jgi:tape measure domain-containing protein
MTQADILAIKVAVQNVGDAQRKLGTIKKQLDDLDNKNSKRGSAQLSLIQRLRNANQDLVESQRRVANTGGGIASAYGKIAGVAATAASAFAGMYASVKAFEGISGTRKGLANMLGSQQAAVDVEKQLRALADKTGTRMSDLFPGTQKLAGTEQVGAAELVPTLKAFIALGKRGGANPEGLSRAFEQFTQIASQGKLQGDELRSIQENGVQLRALLSRAGLGDRIGSQTNPITFKEIQKALLEFGNSADATASLAIGSDNATASFNRLINLLQVDLLPIIGKVLTPAFAKLGDLLRNFLGSMSPEKLQKLGDNIAQAVLSIGKLALEALPVLIKVVTSLAPILTGIVTTFEKLDKSLNGNLLKTLLVIGAVKVGRGMVGSAAGGAAGGAAASWGGAVASWLGKGAWKLLITGVTNFAAWFGALAEGLPVVGAAIAGFVTALGGTIATASAGLIAAVVAVGAAIGAAIGWLINQIPGVQSLQKGLGEAFNDTFWGGEKIREEAAQGDAAFKPGGRIYEKRQAELAKPAQSTRRSDPQRIIMEGGAMGLKYAR